MAFTNSPTNQTYKTEQVKFDDTATYRSGNLISVQRDSAIWNMFYDRISQENKTRDVSLKKRPGITTTSYTLDKVSSASNIRGYFYDISSNRFYWAVDDKVKYVEPDVSTTVYNVTTLATSSGYVGFCDFYRASDTTRHVVFSDGTDLWLDQIGGSCTKVTDADMPTPHVPQPVQLDGYIFLAALNTNDMYNCVNDDPFTWEPGDFISAEMVGDYIVKLANNRNYIVAFGNGSLEIFWNAAEASGSPMKRNESGFKSIGYVAGACQIADKLYFIGQDKSKNLSVFVMDGFKVERISDEVVDRSLQNITSTTNVKSQVLLNRDGYSLSVDGHTFYVIVSGQTTWVYDIDEKFWYEWKGSDDTGLNIQATWSMYNGAQYVALGGQTLISLMAPNVYQDFSSNFKCRYVTQDLTFGTLNWKTCNRLTVQGDMHAYTGSSLLQVSWSDNDWGDGGSGITLPINVFSSSPYVTRLGRFRNRSFRLDYSDNYPLRLRQMELDINVGNT